MIIGFVTFVVALQGLIACTSTAQGFGNISDFATESNALHVYAIPVGQGDCTFIECPNGNIVVFDCGSAPEGNRMTADEIKNWLGDSLNRVVAILISHPDRYNYNYLNQISWNATNMDAVIIGGVQSSSGYGLLHDWLNAWRNRGKLYEIGAARDLPGSTCIGNCVVKNNVRNIDTDFCKDSNIRFDILAANVRAPSNQQSIVMKIDYFSHWTMLLPGDMEGQASLNIADELKQDLVSNVYKMSRHGASRRANLVRWLDNILPQFSFASSGYNFGSCTYPRCETIRRLENLGSMAMTAPPHRFYCGNGGNPPTNYGSYRYNILQTSPDPNSLCILTYVSSLIEQPHGTCIQRTSPSTVQSQSNDTDSIDTDCDEEDDVGASAAGTSSTIESIFALILLQHFSILLYS